MSASIRIRLRKVCLEFEPAFLALMPVPSLCYGHADQVAARTAPATGGTAIVLCTALRPACCSGCGYMACSSALGNCYVVEGVFFVRRLDVRSSAHIEITGR